MQSHHGDSSRSIFIELKRRRQDGPRPVHASRGRARADAGFLKPTEAALPLPIASAAMELGTFSNESAKDQRVSEVSMGIFLSERRWK